MGTNSAILPAKVLSSPAYKRLSLILALLQASRKLLPVLTSESKKGLFSMALLKAEFYSIFYVHNVKLPQNLIHNSAKY